MAMLKKAKILAVTMTLQMCLQPSFAQVSDGDKFKSWEGKCLSSPDGEKHCGILQTLMGENDTPMSRLLFHKTSQGILALHVKVPLGVNLVANVKVLVDNDLVADVPYSLCEPEGCDAIMPVNENLEAAIKKGSSLSVVFYRANEEFKFNASLSGVTKGINSL